jgi:hypothetical protein
MSLIRLSRRGSWWKDAGILMLRHQLAVAQRQRPRVHVRLTWPDRAWLALLAGTLPIGRLAGMRLVVTPGSHHGGGPADRVDMYQVGGVDGRGAAVCG